MVNQVNPPPHTPIPVVLAKMPGVLPFLQAWERILFQLWLRTGGSEDIVDASTESLNTNTLSQLNALEQRLGSGDILTIDTTGFTVDTTKQFTDQVQA